MSGNSGNGISPWFVGDTAPVWKIQLLPDNPTVNYVSVSGLTTSNFSLTIRNDTTGSEQGGTGTFSSITAAVTKTDAYGNTLVSSPASVWYQPSLADTSTPGNYHLCVAVTFGNGTQTFDLGEWTVQGR